MHRRQERRQEGVVLIFGVILLVALTATVITYVCLVGSETKHIGYQVGDSQALYLAEAGIDHALWFLRNGFNPDEIEGETKYLSEGKSYTILEVSGSYAFSGLTFTATASSNELDAPKAVDNDLGTHWESEKKPGKEWVQLEFSYPISFDRASFHVISDKRPIDYKWQVEKNIDKKGQVKNWETVFTKKGNTEPDVIDIFDKGFVENKRYLRLLVTEAGDGTNKTIVAVKEIELPRSIHIESQGTVQYPENNLIKTVEQDFWVDTQTDPVIITPVIGTRQER